MRSALPAPWTSMYQSVRTHARSGVRAGAGRGVCAFTELCGSDGDAGTYLGLCE